MRAPQHLFLTKLLKVEKVTTGEELKGRECVDHGIEFISDEEISEFDVVVWRCQNTNLLDDQMMVSDVRRNDLPESGETISENFCKTSAMA